MLITDDHTFLGYVQLHCTTERALFSYKDVLRLHTLAGVSIEVSEGFQVMHEEYAKPLIQAARERLSHGNV
jgi:hypothetical protein